MKEEALIEIFKTKIDWSVDPFHHREKEPVYLARLSDSEQCATEDLSTMPQDLLSLYKPGTKIVIPESKKRIRVNTRDETYLNIVNEPLSHDEISDLATAFVDESFLYPHFSLGNQEASEIEIYSAEAVYHLSRNKKTATDPCFVVKESGKASYRCSFDFIANLARDITFYFAPGTKIRIPRWGHSIQLDIDRTRQLTVANVPLTPEQISDLLTGFAQRLNYLKKEYEKNCKLGCAQRV